MKKEKEGVFWGNPKSLSGWYVLRFINLEKRWDREDLDTHTCASLRESGNQQVPPLLPTQEGSESSQGWGRLSSHLTSSSSTVSATLTLLPLLIADIKIYFYSGTFSAHFEVAASVVEH